MVCHAGQPLLHGFPSSLGHRRDHQVVLGRPPAELVAGVAQVTDADELAAVVDSVLAAHPQAVADFRSGKQQAIGALIQGVKAATGGRGDLKLASQLLRKRLSE